MFQKYRKYFREKEESQRSDHLLSHSLNCRSKEKSEEVKVKVKKVKVKVKVKVRIKVK